MDIDDIPPHCMLHDLTRVLMGIAYIDANGDVIHTKAQVWRSDRWVVYVYSETKHGNPHFHVRCTDGQECSYDLSGSVLAGSIGAKEHKTVLKWLEVGRGAQCVLDKWDELNGWKR